MALKIKFLKQYEIEEEKRLAIFDDLKMKSSALKKLLITQKIPLQDHPKDLKQLMQDIKRVYQAEATVKPKDMYVPDFLLCPITGDFMKEPVTLTSGRTYEKESIESYFQCQREKAAEYRENIEDDEERERFKDEDLITCPITMQKVEESVLIPNIGIKTATRQFLEQNPWANSF